MPLATLVLALGTAIASSVGVRPQTVGLRDNPLALALTAVPFALIALALAPVAARRRVTGLLALIGLTSAASGAAAVASALTVAAWLSEWLWWAPYGLVPLLLLLFPDDEPRSPRWRPAMAAALVGLVAPLAGLALAAAGEPRALYAPGAPLPAVSRAGLAVALAGSAVAVASTAAGLAALALRARGRDAAAGPARSLLVAGLVVLAAFALDLFSVPWAWAVGAAALPVGVIVAVLRHDLYGARPFLDRILVHAGVGAWVLAVYAFVISLLSRITGTPDVTGTAIVAVAVVLATLQPVTRRVERMVRRLVRGRGDEPWAVLAELGRHLGDRLDDRAGPEEVLTTIADNLCEVLQVPWVSVELEGGGARVEVGTPVGEPLTLPLVYLGRRLGVLRVRPPVPAPAFAPADVRLLEDYARLAGPAVHATELTARLRESRSRIVRSREEERRRLRRDLHDRVGPIISGVRLTLLAAARRADAGGVMTTDELEEIGADLDLAMGEVRRLLDGLRPRALDDLGLVGSLHAEAERRNAVAPDDGPVVRVDAGELSRPMPAAVEDVAYGIALEALNNVVRHADARSCTIRVTASDALELAIEDDGRGLPSDRASGIGLESMREQARRIDGTCLVRPRPGGGTVVAVRLPW